MKKYCEHCNDEFEAKRKDVVYCSPSCRQMAYMERKLRNGSISDTIEGITMPKNETSIDTLEENVNSSIDILKEQTELLSDSIQNGDTEGKKPSIDVSQNVNKEAYKEVVSEFVNEIHDMVNTRDYIYTLNTLLKSDATIVQCYWVSERLKCLSECLLIFSEMKTTPLDDLKEVCNAFTMVINSEYYKKLPVKYPYTLKISLWRNKLKQLCIDNEGDEEIAFRLSKANKMELMATRYELAHYCYKKTFSQINFKE